MSLQKGWSLIQERGREREREREREGEREREKERQRVTCSYAMGRTVLLSCLKKVNLGGV